VPLRFSVIYYERRNREIDHTHFPRRCLTDHELYSRNIRSPNLPSPINNPPTCPNFHPPLTPLQHLYRPLAVFSPGYPTIQHCPGHPPCKVYANPVFQHSISQYSYLENARGLHVAGCRGSQLHGFYSCGLVGLVTETIPTLYACQDGYNCGVYVLPGEVGDVERV